MAIKEIHKLAPAVLPLTDKSRFSAFKKYPISCEKLCREVTIMTSQKKSPSGMAGASAFNSLNSSNNYTISSIESQFRQTMQASGIHYSGEIIADGKLHRFHIEGHKQSRRNGAYTLHLNGRPAGYFEDWKTGIKQTWKYYGGSVTSYESEQLIQTKKLALEAEQCKRHAAAAERARYIWYRSKPITKQSDYAYLVNKRIQPHGARLYKGALVIPMYNESSELVNLQFIAKDGSKNFLTGGRKRGCFNYIGGLTQRVLICEGFATGASLFEESEQLVVVAFDAGNLLPVAKTVRELAPDAEIIICGDNDVSGIGQAKAREAALAIGSKVLIPPTPGMDWNDVVVSRGEARHEC